MTPESLPRLATDVQIRYGCDNRGCGDAVSLRVIRKKIPPVSGKVRSAVEPPPVSPGT